MNNQNIKLPTEEQEIALDLVEIWHDYKPAIFAQVAVIAEAGRAATALNLTDALRQKARADAHKLAGSVGSFGFTEATRLAAAIERMLNSAETFDAQQALQLSESAEALRLELEKGMTGN